jgi:predicted TIM-barrel fold metal-dependent hydrolase
MTAIPIISVDGHVRAPVDGYREYIEARYLPAFDEWAAAGRAQNRGNVQASLRDEAQWDVALRLADLESQGVVAEVLFPNGVPFAEQQFADAGPAADPELTRAGMRAYNRWLADFCAQAPDRLAGQALVLFEDVEQAVRDVHWAREHGLGGVMMPGLYPGGTYFFDPVLDPIWAAIQETGLPVSQHGGAGAPVYTPGGLAAILTLAYEHSFFSGRSLWQMIVGGVFDRFPDLTVVFVETGAQWIGPALQSFDTRIKRGDDWMQFAAFLKREAKFSRLPSEYWESNCYAGISPFSPEQVPVAKLGSRCELQPGEFAIRCANSMFGVDYPHFESIYPATGQQVAVLAGEPSITESDLRRILFENAARVYGFDMHALQPVTDRVAAGLAVESHRQLAG